MRSDRREAGGRARDGRRVRGTKPLELVLLPVRVGCPAASWPFSSPTAAVATQRVKSRVEPISINLC